MVGMFLSGGLFPRKPRKNTLFAGKWIFVGKCSPFPQTSYFKVMQQPPRDFLQLHTNCWFLKPWTLLLLGVYLFENILTCYSDSVGWKCSTADIWGSCEAGTALWNQAALCTGIDITPSRWALGNGKAPLCTKLMAGLWSPGTEAQLQMLLMDKRIWFSPQWTKYTHFVLG